MFRGNKKIQNVNDNEIKDQRLDKHTYYSFKLTIKGDQPMPSSSSSSSS